MLFLNGGAPVDGLHEKNLVPRQQLHPSTLQKKKKNGERQKSTLASVMRTICQEDIYPMATKWGGAMRG